MSEKPKSMRGPTEPFVVVEGKPPAKLKPQVATLLLSDSQLVDSQLKENLEWYYELVSARIKETQKQLDSEVEARQVG